MSIQKKTRVFFLSSDSITAFSRPARAIAAFDLFTSVTRSFLSKYECSSTKLCITAGTLRDGTVDFPAEYISMTATVLIVDLSRVIFECEIFL